MQLLRSEMNSLDAAGELLKNQMEYPDLTMFALGNKDEDLAATGLLQQCALHMAYMHSEKNPHVNGLPCPKCIFKREYDARAYSDFWRART